METAKLRKFAQFARRSLIEQVGAKLKLVLAEESPARRESPSAIKKLEEAIAEQGKEQVVERVAYIWFNRLVALRFMDVNRYNRIGVVSPAEEQFQPEILADAKMGHIDEEMVVENTRKRAFALLDGKMPSQDPQGEAYRLLVVAACNYWYSAMPFLFERIDDYTELLMPDDLLSGNSILAYTREAMTPDVCKDVEVIGWLYQFYISEKKDQVFADLKKNKKVTPENIPAATQLFTPHWIVRYLVENSLGRLWMLNRPDSGLIEQMDYYIKPEEPETDFLRISSPEEIQICDPACGSGHMLTYAFDLLYAIYEEEGYEPADISAKILTHNLYGIEIDERAGELAAFALTMKARAKQRRFFRKPVQPNICVLENIRFDEGELKEYMEFVGCDLFTAPLQTTLRQFEESDNFGSLIRPGLTDVEDMLAILAAKDVAGQLFLSQTHQKVLQALRQAKYLSPTYHVVVANPPYANATGLNPKLVRFVKANYPDSKADLMTCFMERAGHLARPNGLWGMINLPSWMFISSFEKLRIKLLENYTIQSLVHLGRGIFGSDFGTVSFVIHNKKPDVRTTGTYRRLFDRHVQVRSPEQIENLFLNQELGKYSIPQNQLRKIPGNPIAYWATDNIVDLFDDESAYLGQKLNLREGINTGDNERFLRLWHEVGDASFDRNVSEKPTALKWKKHRKGGPFRKWYGNGEYALNWGEVGQEIHSYHGLPLEYRGAPMRGKQFFLKEAASWTRVSSGDFAIRHSPPGETFDSTAPSIFGSSDELLVAEAFLNGPISRFLLGMLSQTIDFRLTGLGRLPLKLPEASHRAIKSSVGQIIQIAKSDWDAYETSWDFTALPLLSPDQRAETLEATYAAVRAHWQGMTNEMQRLEQENNRIFIEAYGLQDELSPEVPIEEITLTCNPAYRYGVKGSEEERETRLLADTMAELISYAVGCVFGRYALDKPGLILANQGETIEDYLQQIPEPSFPADEDNVIPMLDGDWFTDDITERFREFLRIAFGEEHYDKNLRFVEQALGKDIRKYFLKDFYNDHVRRYKKRPIYWLFSSPKGSFNALIYMHRYQPHTVGTVLEYLRDFKDEKLKARKNHLEAVSISSSASQGEKTKALKEIEKINKILAELDDYEREVLYPLATEQVEIDLDDGVKANYPKFGSALKKITGLSG
ncbi:BREX-1 system adenine-specific DNA-methyltransferase PglX [Halomonas ventosae]|uniref:site-specific DNA-methyltransferase (adenine-specific) n=1 Tax=Halomonas ventosae TaxID=229007 RepID=A0A4R6I015_9GAMM|nr:BREX-1 system adenine-specific DNA-methyltransferase PglX [Halomonas ventosae]TDO15183.1 type II restriction/modification system DNA methylase subunit YeeA [Halomonas ventosae]